MRLELFCACNCHFAHVQQHHVTHSNGEQHAYISCLCYVVMAPGLFQRHLAQTEVGSQTDTPAP